MTKINIVGLTELAAQLNVNRQTVKSWYRRERLPAPDAVLACGPIWRQATIDRWLKGSGRQRVRLARQLGVSS